MPSEYGLVETVENERNNRFLTGTLLTFQEGEKNYQLSISTSRLCTKKWLRVDTALFFVLTLFMATGWRRVYNAGHEDEVRRTI